MNTDKEFFYEDTLLQCGHIAAEISQLLTTLDKLEANPSVIDFVKANILRYDREVIRKLARAENAIFDLKRLVTRWAAIATARLQ
jgi:hypothetical protein